MVPLVIFGLALFLSLIGMAVVLLISPKAVKITEKFVCPAGSKMEINKVKLSYHRPGEHGLVVMCKGSGINKWVNGKAFFYFWGVLFLCSFIVAIPLGMYLVSKLS